MSTCVLDHIVHLTPPGTVEQASSEFRKLGFDVIRGGTHADGLTYNALVVLADGVYLELIAFVHPGTPDPSHRWGSARPGGWIDFAYLGLCSEVDRVINERAARDESGVVYAKGVDGGRETPGDESGKGKKTLRWRVTCPERKHGVGRLPFFCADVTPREWRVPEAGNHPSTAQGLSYIKVLAGSKDEFTTLVAQLSTVIGGPPSSSSPSSASHVSNRFVTSPGVTSFAKWDLDTPTPLPGLSTQLILEGIASTSTSSGIGRPHNSDVSSGIHEVGFWVKHGHDGGQADSPYGKIVWTPLP